MEETVVDTLYAEFQALNEVLAGAGELSLQNTANEVFRKTLLLAAGSLFEVTILEIIQQFVAETSNNDRVVAFVRSKGLSRQYHTLFDWDRNNANPFFRLFGDEFRELMKVQVDGDAELAEAITAFIEIGRERNRMVHENFGVYALEKTSDEIYVLYDKARVFTARLPALLRTELQGAA